MPAISKVIGAAQGVSEGRLIEWQISPVVLGLVELTFGASENYPTGGIDFGSLVSSLFPQVQEVLGAVVVGHNLGGYVVGYDPTTGRLKIYGQEPTNTTTGVIALTELPAGSSVTQGRKIRVLFYGV